MQLYFFQQYLPKCWQIDFILQQFSYVLSNLDKELEAKIIFQMLQK